MVTNLEITTLAVNPDFQITFERLLELTEIDDDIDKEEENEVLNPSAYAVSGSIELLTKLYQLLGQNFPRGFSSLESRGGINLIWTDQDFDKEVRVKFPVSCQFKGSLYYRKGDNSALIENPCLEQVYQLLLWLSSDQEIVSL